MQKKKNAENPQLLQHDLDFLKIKGFRTLVGMDEAGRGPLAGPVVAACARLQSFDFTCRIDDSKKLTPKARQNAFNEIITKAVIGIGIVDHQVIDEINIFKATFQAMEKALLNLGEKPECLLIDGPTPLKLPYPVFPIVNGDALSFSIACASIVAKVARDHMMEDYDELYPEYGFKVHKGYGTPYHFQRLREFGLSPIHRRSFNTGIRSS